MPKKILFFDSSRTLVESARRILSCFDCEVQGVFSEHEAFSLIQQQGSWHSIFFGVSILNQREVEKTLKELSKFPTSIIKSIVIFKDKNISSDFSWLMSNGNLHILPRPFQSKELLHVINQIDSMASVGSLPLENEKKIEKDVEELFDQGEEGTPQPMPPIEFQQKIENLANFFTIINQSAQKNVQSEVFAKIEKKQQIEEDPVLKQKIDPVQMPRPPFLKNMPIPEEMLVQLEVIASRGLQYEKLLELTTKEIQRIVKEVAPSLIEEFIKREFEAYKSAILEKVSQSALIDKKLQA